MHGLKKNANEIQRAIKFYASAYKAIRELQEKPSPLIPVGDQKTGSIGKFYIYLYLTHRFPDSTLAYGNHNQSGWCIQVLTPDKPDFKVEVKTVSAYSKDRNISRIHHGWDELHLIYVDKMLQPEGFWIIRDSTIVGRDKPLKGKKCPVPGKAGTGSEDISFGDNLIEDLRKSIAWIIK